MKLLMIKNDLNIRKMSLKLIIILVLSSNINKISGDEDSAEGRYIDLLPEQEKKDFLETIARRILEEVESKKSSAKSGEIPDSQLDKHQDYVARILKEEKERLMKQRNATTPAKPLLRTTDEKDEIPKVQTLDKEKSGNSDNEGKKPENLDGVDKTIKEGDEKKKNLQKNKLDKSNGTKTENKTAETPILHSHEVEIVSNSKNNENYSIEITIDNKDSDEEKNGTSKNLLVERQIPVMIEYASDKPESILRTSAQKAKFYEKSRDDELDNTRRHTNVTTTESSIKITQKVKINELKDVSSTQKPVRRRKFKVSRKVNKKDNPSDNDDQSPKKKENDLVDGPTTLKMYTLTEKKERKVKRSYTTEVLTTPIVRTDDTTVSSIPPSTNDDKEEKINSTQLDKPSDITNTYNESNTNASPSSISQTPDYFEYGYIRRRTNDGVTKEITQVDKKQSNEVTTASEIKVTTTEDLKTISATESIQEKEKEKEEISPKPVILSTTESNIDVSTAMPDNATTESIDVSTKIPVIANESESKIEDSTKIPIIDSTIESKIEILSETPAITSTTESVGLTETPIDKKEVIESTVKIVTNAYRNPTRTPEIALTTPKTKTIVAEITETKTLEKDVKTYKKNKSPLPIDMILRGVNLLNMQSREEINLRDENLNLDENRKNVEVDVNVGDDYIDPKIFYDLYKKHDSKNKLKEYEVYEILNPDDAFKIINAKFPKDNKVLRTNNGNEAHISNKDDALRSQNLLLEEPYYVPVYNYAPENAYFSGYNKYGPNPDDSRKTFQFNLNSIELAPPIIKKKNNIKNNYDIITKVKPNYFGIYVHPDTTADYDHTYIDADYEDRRDKDERDDDRDDDREDEREMKPIFRTPMKARRKRKDKKDKSRGIFPNSEDAEHPMNVMKSKPFKSYIGAVRQILVMNGQYTNPNMFTKSTTTTTTEEPEPTTDKTKKIKKKLKRTRTYVTLEDLIARLKKDDIIKTTNKPKQKKGKQKVVALDYFFGDLEKDNSVGFNTREDLIDLAKKLLTYRTSLDSLEEKISQYLRQKKEKKTKNSTVDQAHLMMINNMSDAKDAVPAILALQSMMRTRNPKMQPYINVMTDQIKIDNEGLEVFDWLATTVDIQAALRKLQNLTKTFEEGSEMASEDLELLYYLVYLYDDAKLILREENKLNRARKEKTGIIVSFKPKSDLIKLNSQDANLLDGFKPMDGLQDEKRLIEDDDVIKIQEYRRLINDVKPLVMFKEDNEEAKEFLKRSTLETKVIAFDSFLKDVENVFFDLHTAIKYVAEISKNNKNIYRNLKELYLTDSKKKEALELLLHLEVTQLIDMVQNSAKRGVKNNYLEYIEYNEKDVDDTLNELITVIRLMAEYNEEKE